MHGTVMTFGKLLEALPSRSCFPQHKWLNSHDYYSNVVLVTNPYIVCPSFLQPAPATNLRSLRARVGYWSRRSQLRTFSPKTHDQEGCRTTVSQSPTMPRRKYTLSGPLIPLQVSTMGNTELSYIYIPTDGNGLTWHTHLAISTLHGIRILFLHVPSILSKLQMLERRNTLSTTLKRHVETSYV